MLLDLRELPDGVALEADLCVVGAGVAGITLARELSGCGLTIVLLESGGGDFESATQDLYTGPNIGMPYYPLKESRLRFFGGTTTVWGGRCTPLDRIDFEKRDWVPHSGWPISLDDLAPFYEKAHRTLGLDPFIYDERLWGELGVEPPPLDPSWFETRFWRFDETDDRFNLSSCNDLVTAPDVRIVLHANAVHIQANADANAVDQIRIKTLEGREGTVTARRFVLASGGIENPRLLLASNDVEVRGIGNSSDQVGRYFMEHPHGRVGFVPSRKVYPLWAMFQKRFRRNGEPLTPLIVPSRKLQQESGILNTALTFKLQRDPQKGVALDKAIYFRLKHRVDPTRAGRRIWRGYRDVRAWLRRHIRPSHARLRVRTGIVGLSAMVRAEQSPNPDSRIQLSAERDALGVHRASLNWQMSALDKHTVRVLADVLSGELERFGIGRLPRSDWIDRESLQWPVDETVGNHPIGGYHHIGTTRMSGLQQDGVVDAHCCVHGYHNLYIAGSSVFPTAGWANPNLTIVALVHRLAGHLAESLRTSAGSASIPNQQTAQRTES
jgi:choline dehydrogenase-like flavoprotein